jgi:hypothetical protein
MSDAPKKPSQHLHLSIQLSESPQGSARPTGTEYLTAVCQEYDENGNCKHYTHEVDSDDVSISSI